MGSEPTDLAERVDQLEAELRAQAARERGELEALVARLRFSEEALREASELASPPDVLVTDVIMPGLSGPELHARLVERFPGLKGLYMSGYPDDVLAPRGLLDPKLKILSKPFSAPALSAAIRETLDDTTKAER